ncbi:MAG: HTH domain-containing protein [Neisseriaceae bacterium]|nr:HTH domain-containing protein [Neisseriaceae bacterium]
MDSRISIIQISQKLGFSTTAIEKNIDYLKENGYLLRIGNKTTGYWKVIK